LIESVELDVAGEIRCTYPRGPENRQHVEVRIGEIKRSITAQTMQSACLQLALRLAFIGHLCKVLSPNSEGVLCGVVYVREGTAMERGLDVPGTIERELANCRRFLLLPDEYELRITLERIM
jgi:hypothetical protein